MPAPAATRAHADQATDSRQVQACYRNLRGYKYQLVREYSLSVALRPAVPIETPYVALHSDGTLVINDRYAWDGPSGPTIDTLSFMRGSLVHDALYQLIRLGRLPAAARRSADVELRRICVEDGMWRFRAWYVYLAVRWFGGGAAEPEASDQEDTVYRVPPRPH